MLSTATTTRTRFDVTDPNDDALPVSTERREQARQKAKALRTRHKRQERRNRWLLSGGIVLALVAVIAVIAISISNSVKPPAPGPLNMLSDGIQIGEGLAVKETAALQPGRSPVPNVPDEGSEVITIDLYTDYLCADCGAFNEANEDLVQTWVESGAATLEVHPLSLLDSRSQGTQYSTRAANAAGCVANYDPNSFLSFHTSLFSSQPEESTPGLSDEELASRARGAGVTNTDSVTRCITDGRFTTWVQEATDRALAGPIPNSELSAIADTPTVLVNGLHYVGAPGDTQAFSAFVVQAAGAQFSEDTSATATPTPMPPVESPLPSTSTPSPTPTRSSAP
jgi:protein-disulfide isomerase